MASQSALAAASADSEVVSPAAVAATPPQKQKRGARFWLVFGSVCLSLFLSALDQNAVSTALPSIINDLHGEEFVWVGTAYALSCTAFLPMSGSLAEIFGRRVMMLFVLIVFALGSALCGSAQSMTWLIAARTVQGIGGGGILALCSIIVSDLVSLEERGAYNGLIGMTWAVAFGIGPTVGGALASAGQWRWLFYLNLPICGIAILMVTLFLRLPTPPGTFSEKIRRMDWLGNVIIIGSTTSLVIGLTWGGVNFSWSSPHVLVPLIIGICGVICFFFYEAFVATNPLVPHALLSNMTSFSGYIQTFINPVNCLAVLYYMAVYFQACKDATPIHSGVLMLPVSLTMGPVIVISGISVTVLKIYRPQIWFGWAVILVGMGCFTLIGADTKLSVVIGILILMGVGAGIIYATTYFPVLSPLPVSENAHALALFSFFRLFAGVWGIAIGATILQNELGKRLPADFLQSLPNGGSGVDLTFSTIPLIRDLPEPLKTEVRQAFGESLRVIWKTLAGVAGVGLLSSVFMKNVPLHNYVDEKWALEGENVGSDGQATDEIAMGEKTGPKAYESSHSSA